MIDSLFIDDLQVHNSLLWGVTRLNMMRGLGSPSPRQVLSPHASRHGATDQTRWYDGRVLELGGQVVGASPVETWQAFDTLKGKMALGSEHLIRFRRSGRADDEQLIVNVASNVDYQADPNDGGIIDWGVTLFAGDPRIYSATLKGGDYDPTATLGGGGATMVGGMVLVGGLVFSTTTATQLELINNGQFPTPPTLTVNGPVTNPIIDNDTIGQSIYINYTLGSNDQVIVNVRPRTITLNGASRVDLFDAAHSTWWELQPGLNRLRLRGSGMVANQSKLTVQYRDATI